MFEELDVIELTHDIKEHKLKKGDTGTIVLIYKKGKAYEVEFVASNGRTIALLTLMPEDLGPALKMDDSISELKIPFYLSAASGTVSAEYNINRNELRFNIKSRADIEGSYKAVTI